MNKVVVVGAGLGGLGAAYFLNQAGFQVVVYEKSKIGAGASGVASGLMHPYPGKKMNRSLDAEVAIRTSKQVLASAQEFATKPLWIDRPILRKAIREEDQELFQRLAETQTDVLFDGETLQILSGVTVHVPQYLEALYRYLKAKGVCFVFESFESAKEDQKVVWTVGENVKKIKAAEQLPLQYIKGQVLLIEAKEVCFSTIGDGYLALSQEEGIVHCGSTYEHHYDSTKPHLETALEKMTPRIQKFYPSFHPKDVLGCKSGVRVSRKGGYLPFLEKIEKNQWLLSGFGSRGLLYHALYGQKLTQCILDEKG